MNWHPLNLSLFLRRLCLILAQVATLTASASISQNASSTNWLSEDAEAAALLYGAPPELSSSLGQPELTITYRNDQLFIDWPLVGPDWILERSSVLSPSLPWSCVPLALAETNSSRISLPVSPSAENMFYRLRKVASIAAGVRGLTGSWAFDDGSGQVAEDCSRQDNSATLTNIAWVRGRIGSGALWFNGGSLEGGGSRGWVSNTNYRVLPPQGGAFSVSLWISPDALPQGWRGLIGNDSDGTNGWHLALHNAGPGTNELVLSSGGAPACNVTGRKLLLPGQWYELTLTYDGREGSIYLDSDLLGRGAVALLANDKPIYFGGGVGNYDSFLGRIDDVRIYTNALTSEEISLTGEWHMDEASGSLLADSSIHGRYGFLLDSTAWISGKEGSGIDLNSSTIVIGNDSLDVLPPTGGSFSIEFWLYPTVIPTTPSRLISCLDSDQSGWELSLNSNGPGRAGFHFCSTNSGGTLDLSAPLALAEEVWSKVDLTYNGGIATLYVNGQKIESGSGGIRGCSGPVVLGTATGVTSFNGIVDELKIYRRELDETEIGPVAKVMWETVLINSPSNLVLQGFGPSGKALTYSIVDVISPTNGTLAHAPGSAVVTYTAGPQKGPDAFAYTVSDGEFTTGPTIVVLSVVEPHWLSPHGGTTPPLDGSSPEHAWLAGPSEALDAIWKTNQYYDCFFYVAGNYETRGWKFAERGTCNAGCKHVGSGTEGPNRTTVKLVDTWDSVNEGQIFAPLAGGVSCDGFEVHNMLLDCNAANNQKYALGEPIWIDIPLLTTARVDTITLHWNDRMIPSSGRLPNGGNVWQFGPAQEFNVCTRLIGTSGYITNCAALISTGRVDIVPVGIVTDQIVLQLKRRAPDVDFYSLAEIEVTGASVCLPFAIGPSGGESRLNTNSADYSVLHILDGNFGTAWASGPEEQVEIVIPLSPGTLVNQVNLFWNCRSIANLGRLGPASDYEIEARDATTGERMAVPFLRQARTPDGTQVNTFSNSIVTDQLLIRLKSREGGVDFYSLREVTLQNGSGSLQPRIPRSLNSLSWDNSYDVLRIFDRDLNTQWASGSQGMIGAMYVVGNNLKFTHLKVIGFGTKALRECFVMAITTLPPWEQGSVELGNVLVENCVFTEPAVENRDGLTVLGMEGRPPLTNAVIRGCSVSGVKPWFAFSQAFTATDVENCLVEDCEKAVYFEPLRGVDDHLGTVLIRSNKFLNVNTGISLLFHSAAEFDPLTLVDNEIVLSGGNGAGFAACDTCDSGPSGTISSLTALNNIVRYADWSVRPMTNDKGLHYSDIRNAVFGNNVIALGTSGALRVRPCPAGYIQPPFQSETCDLHDPAPPPPPTYPPCLDILRPGYRRAWYNNRDLAGTRLNVRYSFFNEDGFAFQQQWP